MRDAFVALAPPRDSDSGVTVGKPVTLAEIRGAGKLPAASVGATSK